MFFDRLREATTPNILQYNSEFKQDGLNLLVSTRDSKFHPFIGQSFNSSTWEMISKADVTCGIKYDKVYNYLLDHFKKGNTVFDEIMII